MFLKNLSSYPPSNEVRLKLCIYALISTAAEHPGVCLRPIPVANLCYDRNLHIYIFKINFGAAEKL